MKEIRQSQSKGDGKDVNLMRMYIAVVGLIEETFFPDATLNVRPHDYLDI